MDSQTDILPHAQAQAQAHTQAQAQGKAPSHPRLLIAAGEASGDMYAAELMPRLVERLPGLTAFGLGGAQSRAAGIETIVDMDQVSVMGLVEVLRHYGQLRAAMHILIEALDRERPDLVIVIDFQEFNQRLAKAAKARGIPVLFFVAPQVWAWRAGRAKHFDRYADHLAVLFDFEVALFAQHGLPTTHVGHPLIELIDREAPDRADARHALSLPDDIPVVGLLPGSRRGEIERLLPPFIATAERLIGADPDRRFIMPRADSIDADWLNAQMAACTPSTALRDRLIVTTGGARRVMAASDALLITSGTATLEAALIGTPMVIAYRSNRLTYALARHLVRIEHIGLPNIILGREAVPERLQEAVTPERLAEDVERLLSPDGAAAQRAALREIRARLGQQGAFERLADLASGMIEA
ncbi:lipid-A-disaccharide synthase [Guyparkeria halophila]|uniref:Lipid-A-disaccharide synthase n=1 Tax=Guyparkeria halophila TaxID=47960 RepID=A0ABZ0YVZ8_9GAMM|nr:lipid-A-disaccharide synthase [Guyparkeria halophila]WQH15933.1 lipid-A-disaccharide synthase [Guyparkeria halophila]